MNLKLYFQVIFFLLAFSKSFSQITLTLDEIYLNNQNSIQNCNTVDFGTVSNNNLLFYYALEKPLNQAVSDGTIKVILKYNSSSSGIEKNAQIISSGIWNNAETHSSTITANIQASEIQVSGSSILLQFLEGGYTYKSCEYPLIKTQTPEFQILPSSVNLSCGSTSTTNFTVWNVNSSPGSPTYSWNVGNGWSLPDGTPVSGTLATSTSSLELKPTSGAILPSNVNLTVTLNGNQYYDTANVTRSNYNPSYTVSGNSQLCSTATYSVNYLPSGTNVTSWSVSNTSVATITANGNQATLTANGNGVVTVSAVVTNACGQTKTITKNNINVGSPTFTGGISGEYNPLVGEQKYYSVSPATGATSYYWYFDVGNNQTGTNIDGWEILNGQGSTGVLVKVGNPGSTVIVCRATNNCGNKIKYKYLSPRTASDPCDETLRFASNPIDSKNLSANRVIWVEDPCDYPYLTKTGTTNNNTPRDKTLLVYNHFGELVFSKTQVENEFNLIELEKGLYVVKYETKKGKLLTKKLIVN